MARYYRRRRRWGRRRYLRRRFGAGGGNRKRPSSYAVAYGFTKQFDKIISKYSGIGDGAGNFGEIYGNAYVLTLCARIFFESNIANKDATLISNLKTTYAGLNKDTLTQMVNELFNGVLENHVESKPRVDIKQAGGLPATTNPSHGNLTETLLSVFKTQFKDSLQKVTKRNLPFSLAVSSWCLSYLKNKKRRKKYLNFWKFKSVPRFMILLTFNLKDIWENTKYGRSLESYLGEIDFLKQTATTRRLIMLAKAGVQTAQEELARVTSTDARNTVHDSLIGPRTTGLGGDVV